jgi:hypothetical protein
VPEAVAKLSSGHLRPPALALTGSPLAWNCRSPPRSQTSLVAHHSCSVRAAIITPVESSAAYLARFTDDSDLPRYLAGRLPHWLFRGLLNVHSRFGPHGPLNPTGPFYRSASDHSSPPDSLRSLPAGARVCRPGFPPGRTMRLAKAHRTIGLRIRISRRGGGSARCSGSRVRVRRRNFSPCTPLSTTPLTSNAISRRPKRTAPFAPRRWTRGAQQSQRPDNS